VTELDRRTFLRSGLAVAGGALAVPGLAAAASSAPPAVPSSVPSEAAAAPPVTSQPSAPTPRRRVGPDPFRLGVASGDPRPDGVVLWTRLAPEPLEPGGGVYGPVPVEWEVATDEAFTHVVARGSETAVPSEAHSVHAEPAALPAGAELFYRFRVHGHISPVGRTRTAPAPGTDPGSVRFAVASCQHLEEGWYHAHRSIAADEPDLVLFLGDYTYEKKSSLAAKVRAYVDVEEIGDLAGYRLRYTQSKLDPMLQAAHAAAAWLAVFDDHELADNWWGTPRRWPATRKQAAFQAYWENMPLPRSMKPVHAAIPLYRRIDWGTLARFHMMDTRQYRWHQAPGGDCEQMRRPDRTLTGAAQERWLLDGLTGGSRWDLLGQQVFFAGQDGDGATSTCDVSADSWDGYQASRRRITQGWVDRRVRNPVVLTGDAHRYWANDLKLNYFDHDAAAVGTEFVTTSITSTGQPVGTDREPPYVAHNPHLNYVGNLRGYVRGTVTGTELTAEYVTLSSILEPNPAKVRATVARRFVVEDGRPGLADA
jgi:alkaline phosphatase D